MTKIKVVTDSSVQLTPEEVEKYQITIVPLSIVIDGKTYVDGIDISRSDFVKAMAQADDLPQTSQPAVGTFVETFKKLLADGSQVLGIFLSTGLSGALEAARQAAQLVDPQKITLVDSLFTDRALGYQVLSGAQDAIQNKSISEILSHLKKIQTGMHLEMMVVNLQNIIKGGRLGALSGRIATLLNIRIALTMRHGRIEIVKKGRGKKFSKKYDDQVIDVIAKLSKVRSVCISYVDTPALMQKLAERIKKLRPDIKVLVRQTSSIVATHAGSGAYAILFYTE